ncbi:DUF4249 domain-containing protein [Carboxylicivirga sp. M1479]|uniref:DUF4249 domain-containing protein n=1 Tax=Carboxylicivirga sp. M1479 TaxID=2594476 RepID=UPI0011773B29|nr:DUF4249 domain-containing protein [Carboxylicivirga sp. M1479]TRX71745.1 DUF4249 domain-containing protein [Carboxylicivirga sp. M1479]
MKQYLINKIMFSFSLCVLLGSMPSCEEVIDIDLNDSDPKLSIDGKIEMGQTAQIQLSYTTDYFSEEAPNYETDAIVNIKELNGRVETLIHQGKGLYTGNIVIGREGFEYELEINVDDKTYLGKSSMLTPTEILNIEYLEFDGFGGSEEETEYQLQIVLKNNPLEENYYLLKYYINGSDKEDTYSVYSHEFFPNEETIEFSPMRFIFTKDDVVTVKAYSIDEGTYDYYSQLDEIIDPHGGGSSTPFNPASNMGQDVLGYFRAWSFDQKTVQIEEEE